MNVYPKTPIEALQCKLAALASIKFMREDSVPDRPSQPNFAQAIDDFYVRSLNRSEIYLWCGHTASQVLAASETYPLDEDAPYLHALQQGGDGVQYTLGHGALPHLSHAFLTFDEPVMPRLPDTGPSPVSALLAVPTYNPEVGRRHYRFYGLDWNGGSRCTLAFMTMWPMPPRDDSYFRTVEGVSEEAPQHADLVMRFFLAASSFVDQKICIDSQAQLSRAGRKLAARANISPAIRTIQLRAREQAASHAGSGQTIEYSCRWFVRGHWRNQFYAKTGDHRPVFIEPYIKGPDDQPLRTPAPDVYVVKR